MAERSWQDTLLAQVEHSRVNPRAPRRSTAINYSQREYSLVLAAARERDISMAAFQRRSALAFAAHDLGFDWATEMAQEPAIAAFGGGGTLQRLQGLGCGAWQILELGEYR